MSNARIVKKKHTRFLADFMVEVSQDAEWEKKLQALQIEDKLNTAEAGYPTEFLQWVPEAEADNLQYSIERVELADIPREASCWWPVDDNTHFYMAYPSEYPQSSIYMAIDFHGDHSDCCG
ncbi:MAG: hypothetical protein CMI08_09570 [Oceanospirillaceae bacterium]|uniref:hypothetical protein n=1 Tax=unclassified Thalassolituus TaxID=2624967 RepID=UPI000C0B0EAF|nr:MULTISPECIES: hypothetical protein [unclassified Thalassolituus]MAK92113.1 hypothetical protein [Thalassolituus sp.]MAX99436.1 hypothetical protein [Oceanospirillaceae bacterium]MBL36437.1 hypothetical protein [Oceanospirillaceae bacterium]MBS54674.1 hypothetical protein [Oceanospirillaceae bacterium]|tara:strand:+ start:366 stop:728 length:363 start_codon:yes stop_codon:yes gene_type:complete